MRLEGVDAEVLEVEKGRVKAVLRGPIATQTLGVRANPQVAVGIYG